MATRSQEFGHLESRHRELVAKYLQPTIDAEKNALENREALPATDFDQLASFRLLMHAELEGYFERKASRALAELQAEFDKDKVRTRDFAALVSLFLFAVPADASSGSQGSKSHPEPMWTPDGKGEFKNSAQRALGQAREFIKTNNGIKEASVYVLSALQGHFPDELDDVLVTTLNEFGKLRGDVAHDSWKHNTRTFQSAEIEKKQVETILSLVETFYESKVSLKMTTTKNISTSPIAELRNL